MNTTTEQSFNRSNDVFSLVLIPHTYEFFIRHFVSYHGIDTKLWSDLVPHLHGRRIEVRWKGSSYVNTVARENVKCYMAPKEVNCPCTCRRQLSLGSQAV